VPGKGNLGKGELGHEEATVRQKSAPVRPKSAEPGVPSRLSTDD
jgi:hypothetical protein